MARAKGGEFTKKQPARSHPQIADRRAPDGGHLKCLTVGDLRGTAC